MEQGARSKEQDWSGSTGQACGRVEPGESPFFIKNTRDRVASWEWQIFFLYRRAPRFRDESAPCSGTGTAVPQKGELTEKICFGGVIFFDGGLLADVFL